MGAQVLEGRVDRDGLIEAEILPTLRRAVLEFPDADGNATSSYELRVGELDPIEQTRGVQSRLNNLGFPCIVDGIAGPKTAAALRCYQRWAGLQETGVADNATRAHLVSTHDGG